MRPNRLIFGIGAVLLLAAGGCRRPTEPDPVVGTFLATTFQLTPTGQAPINVLSQGGTLGINVANNFVTAGTLILPASVTGGTAFTASMAGTATRTESIVRFTQPADTFVRNLTFTLTDDRLEAVNQTVGGATYNLILTKQ
jgi:hypothetical protein